VIGFTSYLLYPMAQPAISIEKKLHEPQSQSGHFEKEKDLLPMLGILPIPWSLS